MDKEKLFPLPEGVEIKIVLHIRAQGEKYELVHVFRDPTAADKKAYWGHITRMELFEGTSGEGKMDYLGANELLYDRCALRVEGYALPEIASRPGAENTDWKKLIPLEHKLWAVENLLERAGSLDEESSKN